MGVWLPLALADLVTVGAALVRLMAANPGEVDIPERSETLASWCLPMMSKSVAAAERERRAREMFNSVERLRRKVGAR